MSAILQRQLHMGSIQEVVLVVVFRFKFILVQALVDWNYWSASLNGFQQY